MISGISNNKRNPTSYHFEDFATILASVDGFKDIVKKNWKWNFQGKPINDIT